MWKLAVTLLAVTVPLSSATATEPLDEAAYHPDQLRSPAGLEHLYAYRPACRQLERRRSEVQGWTAWGMKDARGKFMQWYGLPEMPEAQAFQYLDEYGLCVFQGALVEMMSPVERDRLLVAANTTPEAPGDRADTMAVEPPTPTADDPYAANRDRAAQLMGAGATASSQTSEGGFIGFLMLIGFIGSVWAGQPFIGKFMTRLRERADAWEPFEDHASTADHYAPYPVNRPDTDLGTETAVQILLASPAVSRAFYGGQRTGKTNLAATVSRQLTQQGWSIYHLNLGAYLEGDVDEDGHYWSHAVMSVKADLLSATETEAQQAIKESLSVIDAFVKGPGKCLLIVDEWKFMASKDNPYAALLAPLMQRLAGQITGLDSNGVKRHKTIWTIAPGIVASAMLAEGKAVKNLAPVLVAIAPGKAVNWQGQDITFSYPCFDQVNHNLGVTIPLPVGKFQSDRICFIDDAWRSLGGAELEADLPQTQRVATTHDIPLSLPAKYQDSVVEQQLYPGISVFIEWLKEKSGVVITYKDFRDTNRFKEIGRSKEQYLEFCDGAVMKGLLTPQGGDRYFVLE